MAKTITLDKWVWVFLLWPFVVWPIVGIISSCFTTSDAEEEVIRAATQEATAAETQPGEPASASKD